MAHYLGLLAETMDTYRLYDRDDRAAQIKNMMDLNLVSEEQAQAYLYALQPLVQEVLRTALPKENDHDSYTYQITERTAD